MRLTINRIIKSTETKTKQMNFTEKAERIKVNTTNIRKKIFKNKKIMQIIINNKEVSTFQPET